LGFGVEAVYHQKMGFSYGLALRGRPEVSAPKTGAIVFGNLGIKKVNIRRTFWLFRCVRSQVLMIFDPDATLQTQKRFPCAQNGVLQWWALQKLEIGALRTGIS
jgi:hypothetical protein